MQWRAVLWGVWILSALELSALGVAKLTGLASDANGRAQLDHAFSKELERFTPEKIHELEQCCYDPLLGYVNKPGFAGTLTNSAGKEYQYALDQLGARKDDLVGDVVGSAYGDSFTYADEVNDNETWSWHLGRKIGGRVLNFGVGGYGTDQALLRLERNRKEGLDAAPMVLLTVYSENINRIANMYLGFYMAGSFAFKPMFHTSLLGDVTLLPNPLRVVETREDLRNAFETSKQYDYWYLRASPPPLEFPFSASLVQLLRYRSEEQRRIGLTTLWNDPEMSKRAHYIIERFRDDAQQYHFRPVVFFIPTHADIEQFQKGEEITYRSFLREIKREDAFSALQFIDLLDYQLDWDRMHIQRLKGHLSPYGNEQVARILAGEISKPIIQ